MKIFAIVLALASSVMLVSAGALKGQSRMQTQQTQEALSQASDLQQQEEEQHMPYQFNYQAESEGGSSSRSESADGTGRVLGQYSIKGADGISRTVSYQADSEGFKANVTTNEPGTENQSPSFIILKSSQLPAAEISRQLTEQQQEEQPIDEAVELPAKPIAATPRKQQAAPAKSRRPAQKALSRKAAAKPAQQQMSLAPQPVSAPPSKRLSAAPISKGSAIRSRGPSKAPAALPAPTKSVAKRPIQLQAPQPALQEDQEAAAPLNQSEEESAEDDSQEGF